MAIVSNNVPVLPAASLPLKIVILFLGRPPPNASFKVGEGKGINLILNCSCNSGVAPKRPHTLLPYLLLILAVILSIKFFFSANVNSLAIIIYPPGFYLIHLINYLSFELYLNNSFVFL